MQKSRVLVTGGSGFIGSHLLKSLGDRGVNYDNKNEYFEDILNPLCLENYIKNNEITCIVHLAAISNLKDSEKNPSLALETNFVGTFNVLRLAHKHKIKTILASSAATSAPELSLYGTSKDCMERLVALFNNVIVARFYNVYGKRSKSVVNKFIQKMKAGAPIHLNGNTVRDYIYIDDVVAAVIDMVDNVEAKNNKVISVGTHKGTSLEELLYLIENILNNNTEVVYDEPIREIPISVCPRASKFYKTPLEDGIRKLI